jgi:hypothetical protein
MEDIKNMETKQYKVVRWKDGNTSPDNLTGHIIVFDDPLIVHQTREVRKLVGKGTGVGGGDVTRIHIEPTGKVAKCSFMRAKGGFGSYKCCSGRMIIGDFFETIQDVLDNKPFQSGNTKCFPDGYIPELFTEHEEL